MSIHIPQPRDLPQTGAAASDAKRSRNGRIGVGVCQIVVGMALALALERAYGRNSSYVATGSELIMADAQNVIFAILLIMGGFWNITARRSNSKDPLIAALVLSGLGLVLGVINVVDIVTATGEMPNVVGFLFHAGIFAQTIRLLRLKPINPLLFFLR